MRTFRPSSNTACKGAYASCRSCRYRVHIHTHAYHTYTPTHSHTQCCDSNLTHLPDLGRTLSWGPAYPDQLALCLAAQFGEIVSLDPLAPETYDLLNLVMSALMPLFVDEYVSLGGEQVRTLSASCAACAAYCSLCV